MNAHNPISNDNADHHTAYDFSFTAITADQPINLLDFKGQVIVIVNTASKCGFTSQYESLEAIYKEYKDKGLVMIGVPSNDFGGQEPGTNQEISNFCQLNYGVSFLMTQKESVIGANAHPFYRWAKKHLGFGTAPKWNFHKYLINSKGELMDYFHSTTSPQSKRFRQAIESLLNEDMGCRS